MNPFGKGALINLLRQFSKLHTDKRQISIGFVGYPNVGKRSVINTLRAKKVCKVAPIAGETKVWQYIALMKRIYLVDCPGVVYPTGSTPADCVLKGVVRVENIKTPEDYIKPMLERVKPEYIHKTYGITSWTDHEDFLSKFAKRSGKLLKGGDPDLSTSAKMILNDFQRGGIPYFVRPPESDNKEKRVEHSAGAKSEPEKTSHEVVVQSTGETSGIKVKNIPAFHQDFQKIRVEPKFTGDDVKQLELEANPDDSDLGSDYDEEEGADGEINDDEDLVGEDGESIADDDVNNDMDGTSENSKDGHLKGREGKVSKVMKIIEKDIRKTMEKKKGQKVVHGSKLEKKSGTKENISKKKKSKNQKSGSDGQALVIDVDETEVIGDTFKAANHPETDMLHDCKKEIGKRKTDKYMGKKRQSFTVFSVEDTANVTCVELEPESASASNVSMNVDEQANVSGHTESKRTPTNTKGKKKRHMEEGDEDGQEAPVPRMTSKKRRRMEREMRQKKIGEHFYTDTNVKNRRSRR